MPINHSKLDNESILEISGDISAPLQPGAVPVADLMRSSAVRLIFDCNITNATAAIQLNRILTRFVDSSAAIKRANGLTIVAAVAANNVLIEDNGSIAFDYLPSDSDGARATILKMLAARIGGSEESIAAYFSQKRKLKSADASALLARPNGFNAKAMLGRDGKIDAERVFAKWNAPRGG